MKVENMKGRTGKSVANQFIIRSKGISRYWDIKGKLHEMTDPRVFQSYGSQIAVVDWFGTTIIDRQEWNYSRTTAKYRNQFLGETTKETEAKIKSGEYILADLN